MPLWMFQACLEGYRDRQLEAVCTGITQAYYTAYYTNAKRAKSPDSIIRRILTSGEAFGRKLPEIDMDAEIAKFKEREEKFRSKGVPV